MVYKKIGKNKTRDVETPDSFQNPGKKIRIKAQNNYTASLISFLFSLYYTFHPLLGYQIIERLIVKCLQKHNGTSSGTEETETGTELSSSAGVDSRLGGRGGAVLVTAGRRGHDTVGGGSSHGLGNGARALYNNQ